MGKKRVFVTGYGTFSTYDVNPSSVIVSNLARLEGEQLPDVVLTTKILNVEYDFVHNFSDMITRGEVEADFFIHVGVHPTMRCVRLESASFRDGYVSRDVRGCVPMNNCCLSREADGGREMPAKLETSLDLQGIKASLAAQHTFDPLWIEVSSDPGRFLCAYLYYCSLFLTGGKSLFVHVPDFDDVTTPELLTQLLKEIIVLVARSLHDTADNDDDDK